MMYLRKLTLALSALFLLVVPGLKAENYYFKRYDKESGLSHQTVFCALQDKRGFMWFGTKAGLNRFDGTNFKVYVADPEQTSALISNTVLSIAEGPDGSFWIGTSLGLCSYDPEKDVFTPFTNQEVVIKDAVDNLAFDKQGNLWVINVHGIYCLDIKSGKCRAFPVSEFFVPTGMLVTQSGSVWILGLDGNIYLYDPAHDHFTQYAILTEDEKKRHIMLYRILECSNGDLMVTTDRIGAKRFSPNSGSVETIFEKDANNNPIYIHTAIQKEKGEFWFGTESGIHIFKLGVGFIGNLQKSYNDDYSLSDNAIHMLLKDREEGVWVGTFFGGINYLARNNTLFEKYLPKDSKGNIKANVIRQIHPDSEGNLWVGTEDGGLCRFDPQSKTFRALTDLTWEGRPISRNIQCLLVDDNLLWIGTFDSGIYQLDLRTQRIVNHFNSENPASGLLVNGIVCLKKTSQNEILVGAMGGLYHYDKTKKRFEIMPELNWGLVHSMYEDMNHTIWIVTMGRGVFTLNYDEHKTPNIKRVPFENNYFTTIFEDSKKQLWIGTEGNGIFLFDRNSGSFVQALPKLDYSGQIIYQIIEDGMGMLWITTSSGLLRYDPNLKTLNRFTTLNGLPIDQFNYNSGYQDRTGNIYFGTLKGMVVFSPENFVKYDEILKVYFTGFQLFSKEIEVSQPDSPLHRSIVFTDAIKLRYDQSTFSIDFAIPTYTMSQNIWYRYKLDGVDKDWITRQGAKKLYYTKLPPGTYTLRVQASRDTEEWAGDVSKLIVTVTPPYWETSWAYFIYTVAVLGTVVYILVTYRRRVKRRAGRQLEKMQSEKHKEILQAKIGFFTNITHEIRTPLTLIMGSLNRIKKSGNKELVENENITIMNKNTQRLLDLVNQLLDFRKIESSSFLMNFIRIDVKQLLEETYTRFTPIAKTKDVHYSLSLPEGQCMVVADKEALTKILSNMFNNAIKFCDRTVDVSLECLQKEENTLVRIRINNDGELIPEKVSQTIFEPFFQHFEEKTKAPINGSGLGLPLAKSLAEMHNGSFYLDKTAAHLNSFVLDLPMEQTVQYESDLSKLNSNQADTGTKEGNKDTSKNMYNILIVDDEVELRQFVLEELSPQYTVLAANNGKQALEILETHNISLVVSDLMMPVMDGTELCKSIKQNIKFCHIPIVVLTAKVSLQAHIDVLESKADAYIEKPFSTEHLLAQIFNLLANRELIRSTFIRSPHAHLVSVASNTMDEEFICKMNEYVMNNLADSHLSVETLAEHMNMSTSTLYRKVKAITSLPANDFIRLCRLKKAAELLASTHYRISEVAERVGFSTTSYFTSCFMKQFGMTPTDFIKNKNT